MDYKQNWKKLKNIMEKDFKGSQNRLHCNLKHKMYINITENNHDIEWAEYVLDTMKRIEKEGE